MSYKKVAYDLSVHEPLASVFLQRYLPETLTFPEFKTLKILASYHFKL